MKLKRITSAVMAAVMAVTSAVVCEVTASAADSVLLDTDTVITDTSTADFYTTINELSQFDKISIKYTYNNADGVATANGGDQWAFSQTLAIKTQELDTYTGNWTAIDVGTNGYVETISNGDSFTVEIDTADVIAHVRNIAAWDSTNDTDTRFKWFITVGDGASKVGTGHIVNEVKLTGGAGAPYEGTKLAMPVNGTWNYQGIEALTLPSAVSISNAKDIIDNYGNVTVTVPLNGAVSGSDTNFDLTKLSFQLVPKTYKGDDWPWTAAGTSTYDAATKTVTITADLAAALNGNTSIAAAPEDYTFNSLELVAMCSLDDATAAIDLYHGTPTVTFSAATVAVTDVTLSDSALTLDEGDTATLTATVLPTNATDSTVTWTSDTPAVATVDSTGKVTAVKEGEAKITATAGEKSADCVVNVNAKTVEATAISIDPTASVKVGNKVTLKATFTPANTTDTTVTWTSSATDVATVADGVVTAIKAGETTITATTANGKTATCKVTVSDTEIPVKTVTITKPTTTEYTVDQTVTLTAKVNDDANVADKTISWKSSDDEVATVDKDGKVKFLKAADSVKITAYYSSATSDAPIEDSIEFKVLDYVEADVHYDEIAKKDPATIPVKVDNAACDLVVISVSEEDSKNYDYIDVTVTPDGGTPITLRIKNLYKGFKFTSVKDELIKETGSEGNYFGLVKINNPNNRKYSIGFEFGVAAR